MFFAWNNSKRRQETEAPLQRKQNNHIEKLPRRRGDRVSLALTANDIMMMSEVEAKCNEQMCERKRGKNGLILIENF